MVSDSQSTLPRVSSLGKPRAARPDSDFSDQDDWENHDRGPSTRSIGAGLPSFPIERRGPQVLHEHSMHECDRRVRNPLYAGPFHSRYPKGKNRSRDSSSSNEPRNRRPLFRLSILEFRPSNLAFRASLGIGTDVPFFASRFSNFVPPVSPSVRAWENETALLSTPSH